MQKILDFASRGIGPAAFLLQELLSKIQNLNFALSWNESLAGHSAIHQDGIVVHLMGHNNPSP
jgi:hypothetical protein